MREESKTHSPFKKGFSLVLKDLSHTREVFPVIAQAGFLGVEPTFNEDSFPSPRGYSKEAPRLREICADMGLEVLGLRGGRKPWDTIPSPDPDDRREALEHTKRALECMGMLGGDVLLVVPGRIHPEVSYEDHWKRVVEYGQRAGELAASMGVQIGLENVEARFPLSVKEWKELLGEIHSSSVRMYLDVGNVAWLGLGYPEQWIRSLGDLICRIHFKDALWGRELRNLLEGEVPWERVMKALREIPYEGWISVEPEWYKTAWQRMVERLSRDLDVIFQL